MPFGYVGRRYLSISAEQVSKSAIYADLWYLRFGKLTGSQCDYFATGNSNNSILQNVNF